MGSKESRRQRKAVSVESGPGEKQSKGARPVRAQGRAEGSGRREIDLTVIS